MAVMYWYVAGNGSSSWDQIANWYFGSGGTGGNTGVAPTAGDDAICDVNSGSGNLQMSTTITVNSLNMTGFTGTIQGGAGFTIDTVTLPPNNDAFILTTGYSAVNTLVISSNLTANLNINISTITLLGSVTINAPTATYICSSDFKTNSQFILTSGHFNAGTNNIWCTTLSSNNTNARTLTAANLYLTGTGAVTHSISNSLIYNVPNIIAANNSSSTKTLAFPTGGGWNKKIYYRGTGTGTQTFTGGASGNFNEYYIEGTGGPANITFPTGQYKRIEFMPGTTSRWVNAGSQTMTLNDFIGSDGIMGIRVASGVTGFGITPAIIFSGATNTGHFDLNGNVLTTGALTINAATVNVPSSFSTNGSVTISNDGTLIYYANINLTVSTFNITMGTLYSGSNTAVITQTTGIFTFTEGLIDVFSDNGTTICNITCDNFTSTGANAKTIGSSGSTFNNIITGNPGPWNSVSSLTMDGIINITFTNTVTSAMVSLQSAGHVFGTGGTVKWDRGVLNGGINTFVGNNTFWNIADVSTGPHLFRLVSGTTTTINGTFQVNGTPGNLITLTTTTTSTASIIKNNGIVSCDYLDISHIVATPALTWYAGTHSVNNQGVSVPGSGWIFTNPPADLYVAKHLGLLGVG